MEYNPSMDLVKLKTFYTAAKLGSFTKAAESLYFTQPAVSLQIKDLEQEYGVQLFERIGKKVRLTRAGEALLPMAEHMLHTYLDSRVAVEQANTSAVGKIRVGATGYTGMHFLPEIMASFQQRYPDNQVMITLHFARQIQAMLLENEIDIGIIGRNQYRLMEESLLEQDLYHDRIVVVVGAQHPWAGRDYVMTEDLADQQIILPSKATLTRQYIERAASKKGIQINLAYEVDNISMIKRLVEHQLGITLMCSGEVRKEIEAGWLRTLKLRDLIIDRKIIMVFHRDKPLSSALNNFIDFLNGTRSEFQNKLIGNQWIEG